MKFLINVKRALVKAILLTMDSIMATIWSLGMTQGRTLVRNTFKRFAVLLPAVFFKLGIAFTMLVLVTIVSVNNGFIGFLLLVVGLSSVLARLQEARRPPTAAAPAIAPYYNPAPYYNHVVPVALRRHYRQEWDRSDVEWRSDEVKNNTGRNLCLVGVIISKQTKPLEDAITSNTVLFLIIRERERKRGEQGTIEHQRYLLVSSPPNLTHHMKKHESSVASINNIIYKIFPRKFFVKGYTQIFNDTIYLKRSTSQDNTALHPRRLVFHFPVLSRAQDFKSNRVARASQCVKKHRQIDYESKPTKKKMDEEK
ncbi:unnamed protein product [Callosobruchus maculatus]|uniref:Uncharacterized protein n=1 Tax=Callosobruchus maculatus TaxID=64391 RepID=A0A653BNA0_CALMS|nr:unnamed protein product [Callosobruchus maculatus]